MNQSKTLPDTNKTPWLSIAEHFRFQLWCLVFRMAMNHYGYKRHAKQALEGWKFNPADDAPNWRHEGAKDAARRVSGYYWE